MIYLEEQKAQQEDRFLRGKLIAYMIYEYFRVTSTRKSILDCTGLVSVTLRGMMSKGLIRDGTKFSYRLEKCLRTTY